MQLLFTTLASNLLKKIYYDTTHWYTVQDHTFNSMSVLLKLYLKQFSIKFINSNDLMSFSDNIQIPIKIYNMSIKLDSLYNSNYI